MTTAPLVRVHTPAQRPWLSRALLAELGRAASTAPAQSIVALQTRPEAAPSYPLLAFLRSADIPWVTEGSGGDVEDAFAAPASGTPAAGGAAVALRGSVLHAATEQLVIGSFTGSMLLAATGSEPAYMGPSEPLGLIWDTGRMTAWLRQNMPLGTLLLSGPGFAGAVTAYRTDTGVVEAFDVLLSADRAEGGTPGPVQAARWETLKRAAAQANAQEFGVELHFGANGLHVPAGHDSFRVPQLLVLGPAMHRGIPANTGSFEGADVEALGRAPFQHLVLRYAASAGWDDGRARALQQRLLWGETLEPQ